MELTGNTDDIFPVASTTTPNAAPICLNNTLADTPIVPDAMPPLANKHVHFVIKPRYKRDDYEENIVFACPSSSQHPLKPLPLADNSYMSYAHNLLARPPVPPTQAAEPVKRNRCKRIISTSIADYHLQRIAYAPIPDDTVLELLQERSPLFHVLETPAVLPIIKPPITSLWITPLSHHKSNTAFKRLINALWDSGAVNGSYMTEALYNLLLADNLVLNIQGCNIKVTLADGVTTCTCIVRCLINLTITIAGLTTSQHLWFNVIKDTPRNEAQDIIIGWPAIVHELKEEFLRLVETADIHGNKLRDNVPDNVPVDSFLASIMASVHQVWEADPDLFESAMPEKGEDAPEDLELRSADYNYLGDNMVEANKEYDDNIFKNVSEELRNDPAIFNFFSNKFRSCCVKEKWTGLTGVEPVKFNFKPNMPTSFNNVAIPVSYKMRDKFDAATKQYIRYLYTTFSEHGWAHPCFLTPKPGGGWRLVVNFNGSRKDGSQGVNRYIDSPFQLRTKALESLVGFMSMNWKYFGDMDLARAFHQVPLDEDTSKRLGVLFPDGVRLPKYLPEGCTPATAYLTLVMKKILGDFIAQGWLLVLFDNFLVGATDASDLLAKLELIYARAMEHSMVFNFGKCHFDTQVDSFFGMRINNDGTYTLSKTRTDAIRVLPVPTTKKEMQSILGILVFASTFVRNFAQLACNLYDTIKLQWDWSQPLATALVQEFIILRDACADAIDLTVPNFSLPMILRTDSSDTAVAGILMTVENIPIDTGQATPYPELANFLKEAVPTRTADVYGLSPDALTALVPLPNHYLRYNVIAVTSRKLSDTAKRAWTVQQKEMYGVVDACKKLAPFLLGGPFILDTDNKNNLDWDSSADVKVAHWIDFLSAYDIVRKRHIPRTHNMVADAFTQLLKIPPGNESLSSIAAHPTEDLRECHHLLAAMTNTEATALLLQAASMDDNIKAAHNAVHGTRKGHWGIDETLRRINANEPALAITRQQVEILNRCCPTCQKFMNKKPPLDTLYKSLKSPSSLARIGVDLAQFCATPEGYSYFIAIVDHFDHYVYLEAVKDKSALSLARVLFKYMTLFGIPTEIISDPGSDLTSHAVAQLIEWFGINHLFSLVDHHESNGVEPSIREVLRHLKHLVFDTNSREHWHQPEFLHAAAFTINNHINRMTGYTPLQLRFGTGLQKHFKAFAELRHPTNATAYLQSYDAMLSTLAESSSRYQDTQIAARKAGSTYHQFQPGDLVFHSVKNVTKPGSRRQGPYEVKVQADNNVSVMNLVTGALHAFHISRLSLFIGGKDEAMKLAQWDQDQHTVVAIVDYVGTPDNRQAMDFLVHYANGDKLWHKWGPDITQSGYFHHYCSLVQPELRMLLHTLSEATEKKRELNKAGFSTIFNDQLIYINLRTWGTHDWFQQLKLPQGNYLVRGIVSNVKSVTRNKRTFHTAKVHFPVFNETYDLTPYDYEYIYQMGRAENDILITENLTAEFPKILAQTHTA